MPFFFLLFIQNWCIVQVLCRYVLPADCLHDLLRSTLGGIADEFSFLGHPVAAGADVDDGQDHYHHPDD